MVVFRHFYSTCWPPRSVLKKTAQLSEYQLHLNSKLSYCSQLLQIPSKSPSPPPASSLTLSLPTLPK